MGNYKSTHTGEEIDNAVARALPGGEIDRLRPNRNLLDNWDFRNVINQRGQAAYTMESGYTFDRWFCTFGTVSVSAAGITIQKTAGRPYVVFSQAFEKGWLKFGETYTLSCIYQGRIISASGKIEEAGYGVVVSGFTGNPTDRVEVYYDPGILVYTVRFVFVTESPITIAAVKLELGTVSTLANDPPADYGTELTKCQRYYWQSDVQFATKDFLNSFILICNAQFPVAMRAVPAITVTSIAGTKNTLSVWASGLDSGLKVTAAYTTKEGINAIYLDSNTPANVNDVYNFRLIANADL